jgi:hypothetical protein
MSADSSVPADRSPAGWFLYGVAAVVACGVAGLILDTCLETRLQPYRWGPDANTSITELRGEKLEEANRQLRTTAMQIGAIVLGVISGALALALCLADALRLRKAIAFVLTPIGAMAGAAGGAVGGYLATQLQERFAQAAGSEHSVTETMMIQAAAWTCAGVGIAIGVWIASAGRRSFIDTLFGGILAGAAVAILYPPIVGLLFSDENTDRLFPEHGLFPQNAAKGSETGAFLFWVLFNGVVFSMILGGVARQAKVLKGTDSAPASATASD